MGYLYINYYYILEILSFLFLFVLFVVGFYRVYIITNILLQEILLFTYIYT